MGVPELLSSRADPLIQLGEIRSPAARASLQVEGVVQVRTGTGRSRLGSLCIIRRHVGRTGRARSGASGIGAAAVRPFGARCRPILGGPPPFITVVIIFLFGEAPSLTWRGASPGEGTSPYGKIEAGEGTSGVARLPIFWLSWRGLGLTVLSSRDRVLVH